MQSVYLEFTNRLLRLLSSATGLKIESKEFKEHVLYNYIILFDRSLGSDQFGIEKLFERLAISHDMDRYRNVGPNFELEGITLREVYYYELFYFLKYGMPNLDKFGLPSTEKLLRMDKPRQFKRYFKKMYPTIKYVSNHFRYRLSHVTDYLQSKEETQ